MRSTWLTMIFGAVFFTLVLVHLHAAGSRGEGAGTQGGGGQTTGEWSMYRGDLAATGASPLNQITTANVGDLQSAGPTRWLRSRKRLVVPTHR